MTLSLPVSSFLPLTGRTRLLRLDAATHTFPFRAGQAAWVGRAGLALRRPYSMASAPIDLVRTGALEFLVALEDDGVPGPHLGGVGPGDLVDVDGPLGGFDLPASVPHAPVLLVAGGTGIAPLRSMWRELLAQPDPPPIALCYSARTLDELAFAIELQQLHAGGRLRLSTTVTRVDEPWAGTKGRVTRRLLADLLDSPLDTRCAICGPAAFVAHVGHLLTDLGVPLTHVATERW